MIQHPSHKLLFCFSGSCFLVLLLASQASADVLVHHNLLDLVHRAEMVFVGTCLSMHEGTSYSSNLGQFGYTEYTFAVEEWIKGEGNGSRSITIRQPRPLSQLYLKSPLSLQEATSFVSLLLAPAYTPGQKYVLFLHAVNEWGLTCPVGNVQGVFKVGNGPDGDPSLTNGLDNLGLFRGMEHVAAATGLNLPASDVAPSVRSKPRLPASTLLSLTRKIVKQDVNR